MNFIHFASLHPRGPFALPEQFFTHPSARGCRGAFALADSFSRILLQEVVEVSFLLLQFLRTLFKSIRILRVRSIPLEE